MHPLPSYIRNDLVKEAVRRIPFAPCLGSEAACFGTRDDGRSLNYVAQFGLSPAAGNRPRIPDVMVVLAGETYRPKSVALNETAFAPLSSVYVFAVRVGPSAQPLALQIPFATKYQEMNARTFGDLQALVDPLCLEMNAVISKGRPIRN